MQPGSAAGKLPRGHIAFLMPVTGERKFLKLQEFIQSVSEGVCARPAGSAAMRAGMPRGGTLRPSH